MQSTPDGCKFSFEKDLANTQPLTASSQTRLAKVMELMAANPEASCILAVYRQKVIGIATRSDLMRVIAAQADWPKLRLSKVITRPVMTVSATEPKTLTSLLQQLEQHRISHLPVVDGQGKLLGLIEQKRLMQKLLHQHQQYRRHWDRETVTRSPQRRRMEPSN
ncbi:MAG: CBS domain-containing protein [Cyanobacteria bacterium J06632_3]